jgi:hypothetical protein
VHRPHKHYSNIVNNSGHYVSSFFPGFLAIFALITIFGNAHRPCEQYLNITTPSLFFFSNFIAIFHLKMQKLPYLAIFSVHSSHCIPVPFRSGPFRGLFRCKYRNNKIAKIWLVNSTGMAPESTGMTGIQQESVGHEQELII